MNSKIIFFFLLGLDVLILLFETLHLSISYNEALVLYHERSFLHYVVKIFISLFGQNAIGLRIAMILFHLGSVIFLYLISKRYLKTERDRLWLVSIFILLPGVISSALIVNHAGLIIFSLFLYIYLDSILNEKYMMGFLLILSLLDAGFSYLFIALAIYYLLQKERGMFFYVGFLYFLSINLYNLKIGGAPSGHFLDTLGVYSAIFTPIVFVYIVFVLYKRFFTQKIDKLWYISVTVFISSLILSFRQRIEIEVFAPYLMMALPIVAESFVQSYRIRVKEFRKRYRLIFDFSLLFLLLNALVVFFNKELYLYLDNPKKHFAYNMYIAKELAQELESKHFDCITTDKKMQLRLKFYGIKICDRRYLKELPLKGINQSDVTIRYKDKVVYRADVTNINNK